MNLRTLLDQLRLLAILEGISYLLFGLTMPLKYMYEIGLPNKIVGMIHGILFILYCLYVVIFATREKWSMSKMIISLAASIFPLATFWVEKVWLKPLKLVRDC